MYDDCIIVIIGCGSCIIYDIIMILLGGEGQVLVRHIIFRYYIIRDIVGYWTENRPVRPET